MLIENELYDKIMNHRDFIETNSIQLKKMDARYIKTVKFFITEGLNQNFWNSNKNLHERFFNKNCKKNLVIDHYLIGKNWESNAREFFNNIIVIDTTVTRILTRTIDINTMI